MNLVNEGVLPPDEPDDRDERREERDMAQERKTLADILAEYRNDADAMDRGWLYQPTAEYVRRLLDRIEAAWKRERGNLMLGPRSWEECIERFKKARETHDDLY